MSIICKTNVHFICEINWLNIANELFCYCGYLFDIYIQKLNVIALLLDIIIYLLFFGYCCSHNRIDVMWCDAMQWEGISCWFKTIIIKQWRSVCGFLLYGLSFFICVI